MGGVLVQDIYKRRTSLPSLPLLPPLVACSWFSRPIPNHKHLASFPLTSHAPPPLRAEPTDFVSVCCTSPTPGTFLLPKMAAAALPDYVTDADAVAKDDFAKWRHGRAPDYTKTRKIWTESTLLPPPLPPVVICLSRALPRLLQVDEVLVGRSPTANPCFLSSPAQPSACRTRRAACRTWWRSS